MNISFIGRVLSKISSDNPNHEVVYQEIMLEAKAYDDESARQAMTTMVKAQEGARKNAQGDTLTVSFDRVIDVKPVLDDIFTDGVRALYRRHFTQADALDVFSRDE